MTCSRFKSLGLRPGCLPAHLTLLGELRNSPGPGARERVPLGPSTHVLGCWDLKTAFLLEKSSGRIGTLCSQEYKARTRTRLRTGGGPHPANCVEVLASPPPPADQSLGVQIALRVNMRPRWSRVSRDPIAPCPYKQRKLDDSGQTHVGTRTMPCDPEGRLGFGGKWGACTRPGMPADHQRLGGEGQTPPGLQKKTTRAFRTSVPQTGGQTRLLTPTHEGKARPLPDGGHHR